MGRAVEVDPNPTWWKRHLQVPSACEVQCRNNGEEIPFQMDKDDFPILSTPTACSQIHLIFLCIDHQYFSALIINVSLH